MNINSTFVISFNKLKTLPVMGGGADSAPPLHFFNNPKSKKDDLFVFLTFKLGIFCQKFKVIGLIWAFLQPFFLFDLENTKMKSIISGGKKQF